MGKLYELLAVEKDVKNVMDKIMTETAETFTKRADHFVEISKTYEPMVESDEDRPDEEFHPMVTTVPDKLAYTEGHMSRAIDVLLQKDRTNQKAKADIEVECSDGTKKVLLADVPVTMLVELENLLAKIRDNVYTKIPTLDPSRVWKEDKERNHCYKAEPFKRQRTRKCNKAIVLHPPTDKFPAQTQLVVEDLPVGNWIHKASSGALSPKQKSDLISRIDRLIAGVKIARSKANDVDADTAQLGKKMFRFINEGILE